MRVFSNYLMGDPGLWGLMSLAHAMPLSGDVFAVIPDHQPIQSYEDYYTATSSYFEGQWHKPIFVHESDFVESEDDIEGVAIVVAGNNVDNDEDDENGGIKLLWSSYSSFLSLSSENVAGILKGVGILYLLLVTLVVLSSPLKYG